MAVSIKRFNLGKDFNLTKVVDFFDSLDLDRDQIIDTNFSTLGKDQTSLIIIYEDTKFPTIVSTVPGDDAVSVPTGTTIIIQFSEDMSAITLSDLVILEDGIDITGTATLDQTDPSKLEIDGAIIDSPQSTYTITINTSVTDTSGNPLEFPFIFNFSTAAIGAGLILNHGSVTVTAPDVAAGFIDITMATTMSNIAYEVTYGHEHSSSLGDVHLSHRTIIKTTSTFRTTFDQATVGTLAFAASPVPVGSIITYHVIGT